MDMEDSEATESVRRRQNSKVKMRTAKTQEELDEACEDLFLDCDDEMTQMHPGEWDCDDDFEYVDADYVHPVSASGAPSEGFDPNDEDSIREHYILRDDAEWCTNATPHPMLTLLLQGWSRWRPKMWQLPWYHQVALIYAWQQVLTAGMPQVRCQANGRQYMVPRLWRIL